MPPAPDDRPLRFGRFEIRPAERTLRVDGAAGRAGRARLRSAARAGPAPRTAGRQAGAARPRLAGHGGGGAQHHRADQQPAQAARSARDRHRAGARLPVRGHARCAGARRAGRWRRVGAARATTCRSSARASSAARRRSRTSARLLAQSRLLTLTGIGGCGKTRLALQFAQQRLADFADGVWFVDLAPLRDAERVASACATALGLGNEPDATTARRAGGAPRRTRKRCSCWTTASTCATGAAALVDACCARRAERGSWPRAARRWASQGEQLYPVRSLSLPATVRPRRHPRRRSRARVRRSGAPGAAGVRGGRRQRRRRRRDLPAARRHRAGDRAGRGARGDAAAVRHRGAARRTGFAC